MGREGNEIPILLARSPSWGETVDGKTIEEEIKGLPTLERSLLITQVMFDFCEELSGEDACRDRLRELFGIDCLEKLEKRLETGI
jgi:hypothetical protein